MALEALTWAHLPRDPKAQRLVPAFSTLSSPSANSISSAESLDDLLPELWLEPSEQWPAAPFDNTGFPHTMFTPNYSPTKPPAPAAFVPAMLRGDSLEYAHSLLPNSLLFPLTEDNLEANEATPRFVELPAPEQRRASAPEKRHGLVSLASSGGSTPGKGPKGLNTQLYKTELCASFMKMAVCPYGSKCQFAHGKAELKSVERPLNWRSKPCANWTRYGLCRYGKRCCFKHGE